MHSNPLVSIITSALNAGDLLERTIQSIKNQRYRNFEYIVIDGGSTDSTIDMVQKYRDVISGFISERDSGIYDAWNKGVKMASGQYISFLGAGDTYRIDGLSKLVLNAVKDEEIDFISSKVVFLKNGIELKTSGSPWSWAKFRHYMNTPHAGALHSRKFFEKYGMFDPNYKIAGDYELLLRAGANLKAGFVSEVTTTMAWGGISQTNSYCLDETEAAKLKNKSVNILVAKLDTYTAKAKRIIRNVHSDGNF